jgi:hypothetical protein|tara:strand:- start:1035 stop:1214 length:180 start_codon:yes stop_codon:yes gene_type:complete
MLEIITGKAKKSMFSGSLFFYYLRVRFKYSTAISIVAVEGINWHKERGTIRFTVRIKQK